MSKRRTKEGAKSNLQSKQNNNKIKSPLIFASDNFVCNKTKGFINKVNIHKLPGKPFGQRIKCTVWQASRNLLWALFLLKDHWNLITIPQSKAAVQYCMSYGTHSPGTHRRGQRLQVHFIYMYSLQLFTHSVHYYMPPIFCMPTNRSVLSVTQCFCYYVQVAPFLQAFQKMIWFSTHFWTQLLH